MNYFNINKIKMGWVVNTVCNSKNQSNKNLIIEISSYDIKGEIVANSFAEYIKKKDPTINIIINKNGNTIYFTIIKYFCFNKKRIIYNGLDFNEQYFEQLYRQMVIMEE